MTTGSADSGRSSADRELPKGFLVGHWTDSIGRTGCTVVLAPDGAVGGVDVRGGAPGTLGTDGLRPGTVIERSHAVLLTGGSAYGLSAVGGVMRYLEERSIGYPIGPVLIPIVGGAVIFDLLSGDPLARPGSDAGYGACEAASTAPELGAVGAGTGATVAKAGSTDRLTQGGVGVVRARAGDAVVAAILVANSVGGIWDGEDHEWVAPLSDWDAASGLLPGANTTIGVVVTDATLTKEQANRVAMVAHDGIARAVRPAHTLYDGDTIFCLAAGTATAPYDAVEAVAAMVVSRAIAVGVRAGQPG